MASSRYLTDTLVSRTKLIESIPASQNAFSDQDITDLMTMEFQSTIVPLIMSVREEFFVVTEDVSLAGDVTEINLPSDSVGLRLRDVYWVDTNGNVVSIPRLSPEQIGAYGNSGIMYTAIGGFCGFYLQGNTVQLYPKNLNNPTTIRLTYHKRANDLCLSTAGGQVIAITGNIISMNNVPSTWTTATRLCAIQDQPSFEFVVDQTLLPDYQQLGRSDPGLTDFAINAISGFDLTVSSEVAQSLSIGSNLTETGFAYFAQFIPVEAYPLLIQSTAMRCLEALGDRDGYQNAGIKYKRMEHDLLTLINPRVEGENVKAINVNSLVKWNRGRWPGSRF